MKKKIIAVALFSIIAGIFVGNNVSASTAESIAKKSYLNGLYRCYNMTRNKGDKAKKDGSNYQIRNQMTAGNVEAKTNSTNRAVTQYKKATNKVFLPNGWTDETKASKPDAATNCYHLLNGGDGFSESIYSRFGKKNWEVGLNSKTEDIEAYLLNMGYQKTEDKSGGGTQNMGEMNVHLSYGYTIYADTDGDGHPNTEQQAVEAQSNIQSASSIITWNTENDNKVEVCYTSAGGDSKNDIVTLYVADVNSSTTCGIYYNYKTIYGRGDDYHTSFADGNTEQNVDIFLSELRASITALNNTSKGKDGGSNQRCKKYPAELMNYEYDAYWLCLDDVELIEDSNTGSEDNSRQNIFKMDYKKQNPGEWVLNKLAGTKYTDQKVSESEKIYLYQHYVAEVAGIKVNCDSTEDDFGTVRWFVSTTEVKTCAIETMSYDTSPTLYSIISESTDGHKGHFLVTNDSEEGQVKITAIIKKLNDNKTKKLTGVTNEELAALTNAAAANDGVHDDPGSDDENEESNPDCHTKAGSLGWVICPIIDTAADAIQAVYENFIVKFLVLEAELFNKNEGGANTYSAWQTFQNIANGMFVTTFLYVIFSQLTGIGIDNYGIKKILPKLIIGALLINLSYIICQLAVDVANIVGYGIGAIFENIGGELTKIQISEDSAKTVQEVGEAGKGGGFVLLALVAAFAVPSLLSMGPSIIIPVILGLISILISIITCFVILSVRKALAVLLVAVSPLAFMCYILPNMRKYFSKWLKLFGGMLLAFPICSALIYGGQMVSRIVLIAGSNEDGAIAFTICLSAAFIAIIPIFMIPKVIFSSMSAISGKLANVGHGARRRASGAFMHSNMAQDAMRQRQQMQNRRAAGISMFTGKPKLTRRAGDKVASVASRTALGRAAFSARNDRIAAASARYEHDKEGRVAGMTAMLGDRAKADGPKEEMKNLTNGLKSAMEKGQESEIAAYTSLLAAKGDAGIDAMYDMFSDPNNNFSEKAKYSFASNAMKKHKSDFKEKDPSLYQFIKDINKGDTGVTLSPEINANKLSGSQMINMTDKAFERLKAQPGNNTIYGTARQALESKDIGSAEGGRAEAIKNLAAKYQDPLSNTPTQSTVAKAAQDAQNASGSAGGNGGSTDSGSGSGSSSGGSADGGGAGGGSADGGAGGGGAGGGSSDGSSGGSGQPLALKQPGSSSDPQDTTISINHHDDGGPKLGGNPTGNGPTLGNPTGNGPTLGNPTGNGPKLGDQPSGGGLNANINGKLGLKRS